MLKYIDSDKLMETIKAHDYLLVAHNNSIDRGMFTAGIQQVIDESPAADVEPVKHGEWKPVDIGGGDYIYVCSVCKQKWTLNDGTPSENHMNFCPNCGADMKEK